MDSVSCVDVLDVFFSIDIMDVSHTVHVLEYMYIYIYILTLFTIGENEENVI